MKVLTARRLEGLEEYYFSRKLEQIRQLESHGHDVINLGIGSPDLPPHATVIDTLTEASKNSKNHGYQSYRGIPELREAMANFLSQKFQVSLEAEREILPLIGSKEGITHISMAFLNKGDQVLIPALGYPTYTSVTRMVEAEPLYYPLKEENNWAPDWRFLESMDTRKVKLLWLNYPHMPTGRSADPEILQRFVDFARSREIILCHDNPYSFILNDRPLSIFEFDREKAVSLELHSLSKTFNMAGWRIGWVSGNAERIQAILKIKSNMDSGMFKPLQLAACSALTLDQDWFDSVNEEYELRRKYVHKILHSLGCSFLPDQVGMFVWGKVGSGTGASLSDEVLERHKIFVTPGFIFGETGRQFVRISLCTPENRLKMALDRLRS